MKWIQINDLGFTHIFELEGDVSTTIHLTGNIEKVKMKLRNIFGSSVIIETFEDIED